MNSTTESGGVPVTTRALQLRVAFGDQCRRSQQLDRRAQRVRRAGRGTRRSQAVPGVPAEWPGPPARRRSARTHRARLLPGRPLLAECARVSRGDRLDRERVAQIGQSHRHRPGSVDRTGHDLVRAAVARTGRGPARRRDRPRVARRPDAPCRGSRSPRPRRRRWERSRSPRSGGAWTGLGGFDWVEPAYRNASGATSSLRLLSRGDTEIAEPGVPRIRAVRAHPGQAAHGLGRDDGAHRLSRGVDQVQVVGLPAEVARGGPEHVVGEHERRSAPPPRERSAPWPGTSCRCAGRGRRTRRRCEGAPRSPCAACRGRHPRPGGSCPPARARS